jgi:glucokinase
MPNKKDPPNVSADLATGSAAQAASPAKPSRAVAGDSSPRHVIGVDLGGTKLLCGLADLECRLLATIEEPTEHGAGAPVLAQIARLAARLASEAGLTSADIAQLVVGVPSVVSPDTGLASLSPNLELPQDRPLADVIATLLGRPVTVENDVNLAAYGEARAGLASDSKSLVFISFGTGVGMGIVINGELLRGAHGRAGEIGFLPVGNDPHSTAPGDENGVFESLVGSAAIREQFARPDETVADLFARATSGDIDALNAIDEIARSASIGLAAVQTLIDPALIVVGGGIGSQEHFLERLRHHVRPLLPFPCRIERSHFGPKAGLIGAVMLAAQIASFAKSEHFR